MGSYLSIRTNDVGIRIDYKKDFTNSGDFFGFEAASPSFMGRSDRKDKIYLVCFLSPGQYDGEAWIHCEDNNLSAYLIELRYISKNYIKVKFIANGIWEVCGKSFELLQSAAEKFYLMSEIVFKERKHNLFVTDKPMTDGPAKEKVHPFFPPDVEPSWKIIELFIDSISSQKERSWRKIMTVAEAKELFEFLKIKIEFPS